MARKNKKQKAANPGEPVEEMEVTPVVDPIEELPVEYEQANEPDPVADEDLTTSEPAEPEPIEETAVPDAVEDFEELTPEETDIEGMAEEIIEAMEAAQQLYEEAGGGEEVIEDDLAFHITLVLKDFKKLLQIASKFVTTASILPISGTVLIEAKTNGEIHMSATNLDNVASMVVPGKVHLAGSVCIPHRVLFDIVKAMPANATIEITANSRNKVSVVYGPLNTLIHGFEAEQMPLLPPFPVEPNYSFIITTTTLARVSKEIQPFVSADESRLTLTGSHWTLGDGRLEVAATDGFRLALLRQELRSPITVSFTAKGMIFEAVNQLVKGIEDMDEVTFAILSTADTRNLFIKVGKLGYFVTHLLQGQYADYSSILDSGDITHSITAKRDEFIQRLKSAKVIADIGESTVELKASPEGYGEFSADAKEVGTSLGKFTATVLGSEVSIIVDGRYLLQAAVAIDDPEIKLELGAKFPAVRISIPGNRSYLHLIMPKFKPR